MGEMPHKSKRQAEQRAAADAKKRRRDENKRVEDEFKSYEPSTDLDITTAMTLGPGPGGSAGAALEASAAKDETRPPFEMEREKASIPPPSDPSPLKGARGSKIPVPFDTNKCPATVEHFGRIHHVDHPSLCTCNHNST